MKYSLVILIITTLKICFIKELNVDLETKLII